MEKTAIVEKIENILIKATGVKNINIEHPSDEKFGDYATNVAMVVANVEKKNPRVVAEEIVNKIEQEKIFEKVEVAGPGFINMYLSKEILLDEAEDLNFDNVMMEKFSKHGQGKTMVIDYSAPNIAKPFGIGHLRSTNIGQAIYNIYKYLGWNTIGDNHLGDWGTQFGKLIVAIKKWNPVETEISDLTIGDLEKLYVKFHEEAETHPEMEDEGREWFSKLEKGDPEAKEIWQKCIDISIKEFNSMYQLLGVNIDYALGESFYQDKMADVLKLMENNKLLKDSQGARIIEFEKMPIAIVTKSNGATTYFLRDLATIKYRMETWKPDLIVYEVGADQELYFRQVFETAKMLGWNTEFYHVAHGLIRFIDGKFSTRKGKTIHLSDVIDKAMTEAKKIAPDNGEEKITKVAIGAIKFNDLSQDPRKDIIFDWDKMMSMDGDSGPYLQYTYARCQSVLGKTEVVEQKNMEQIPTSANEVEISLLRELGRFEEKLVESATRFSPSVLAEYLLTTARKYNEFYAKNKIIGSNEETWRVFLTKTTANVIHKGLWLLGVETIEQM